MSGALISFFSFRTGHLFFSIVIQFNSMALVGWLTCLSSPYSLCIKLPLCRVDKVRCPFFFLGRWRWWCFFSCFCFSLLLSQVSRHSLQFKCTIKVILDPNGVSEELAGTLNLFPLCHTQVRQLSWNEIHRWIYFLSLSSPLFFFFIIFIQVKVQEVRTRTRSRRVRIATVSSREKNE